MIIGIDETGNFDKGLSYFNAVLIKPSTKDIVYQQYLAWEKATRKCFNLKDEIKGNKLNRHGLESFVMNFLELNHNNLWILPVTVEGIEENQQAQHCKIQKDITIEGIEEAIRFYTKRDNKRSPIVIEYEHMLDWYRALNLTEILKIWTLSYLIPKAIKDSVDLSIYNGFDKDLDQLQIYIDNSFLSRRGIITTNWKDLLRSHLWQGFYKNPLTMIDEWDENHPFIKTFIQETKGNKIIFKPTFKERITFANSQNEIPIRIADITATIIRKRTTSIINRGIFARTKILFPHKNFNQLVLTNNRSSIPNPYTEL